MTLLPGFVLRRYENQVLRYDTDFGNQILIKIRLNKDENGITRTPVTPLLTSRFVDVGDCKAPKARTLEPRQIRACFNNPVNQNGESILTVFIPYKPTDTNNHNGHIREIRDYQDVAAIEYQGEDSQKR